MAKKLVIKNGSVKHRYDIKKDYELEDGEED